MAENDTASAQSKTVETVQSLLALAQDESNDNESSNAALRAARLMKQNGLVVVSAAELQKAEDVLRATREELAKVQAAAKDERKRGMLVGALAGAALSKYL